MWAEGNPPHTPWHLRSQWLSSDFSMLTKGSRISKVTLLHLKTSKNIAKLSKTSKTVVQNHPKHYKRAKRLISFSASRALNGGGGGGCRRGRDAAAVTLLSILKSGCHSPEALAASKKGFFVYAPDHLGHGKSPGIRNDTKSFLYFVDDALELLKLAKEEDSALPFPHFRFFTFHLQ